MPIATQIPQLSFDEIEDVDGAIALFASGDTSEALQIAVDQIIISIVYHP